MPSRKPRAKRPLTPVEKLDLAVAEAVALDRRSRAGRAVASFAELGDQPPLVAISLAVAAAGTLRRDERLARTGLRMLAAHSLTIIGKALGKSTIDRTRPKDALRNGHYRMEEGDSHESRLRSMPSGHSAGATAAALAAIEDYPAAAVPIAAGAAAIVIAQLPSKNHFLSDAAAGALIGLAAWGIARLAIPRFDKVRPSPLRPALP